MRGVKISARREVLTIQGCCAVSKAGFFFLFVAVLVAQISIIQQLGLLDPSHSIFVFLWEEEENKSHGDNS